ncbi:hypothetical protein C0Q70_05862 [Pomacea canaliculata]|uniref:Alpha-carbonic anhydrase domain-containing protein n=1 Tax=Pomacea canaliculata TaxID=400727 RepID=A0A2T7PMD3_POMCA|nr:hypothetical protein C0Q70_05862 [Pomacea canaliculata]
MTSLGSWRPLSLPVSQGEDATDVLQAPTGSRCYRRRQTDVHAESASRRPSPSISEFLTESREQTRPRKTTHTLARVRTARARVCVWFFCCISCLSLLRTSQPISRATITSPDPYLGASRCLILSGTLQNNGHDVTFYVNHSSHSTRQMTVTSGPLSYTFRVDRVRFHFGRNENESGSEHTVGGQGFLVEMQILAFNSELYPDFKTAEHAPHGLLAIAVFARLAALQVLRQDTRNNPVMLMGGNIRPNSSCTSAPFAPTSTS